MKLAGMLLWGLVSLVLSCSSTTTGDGRGMGSTQRQEYISFTKNAPGEGSLVMYAFLDSPKVTTLAYLQREGKPVVDSKDGALEEGEQATLEQLFTGQLRSAYSADNYTGPGCPESERVCSPTATGLPPTCRCNTPTLQFEVVYHRLQEYGSYWFREPLGEATTAMVNALEAMRSHHYGK